MSFCLEFETDYEQVSIKKNRRNGEGGGGTTTRGTTVAKLKFRGCTKTIPGVVPRHVPGVVPIMFRGMSGGFTTATAMPKAAY